MGNPQPSASSLVIPPCSRPSPAACRDSAACTLAVAPLHRDRVDRRWQLHASRTRNSYYRDRVMLPSLTPDRRALLRSQSGPLAGGEPATTLSHAGGTAQALAPSPAHHHSPMRLARMRRKRGRHTAYGDHALACPRTGLLSPGVPADDRRRLDLIVHSATPLGLALCCDATLVAPLTRTGLPQPCAAENDGAALRLAEGRKRAAYPELARGGPQRLVVLGAEVGGRWNGGALRFVRDLIRLHTCRTPPTVRQAAAAGWARRWQAAVGTTALGQAPCISAGSDFTPLPLDRILEPGVSAAMQLATCPCGLETTSRRRRKGALKKKQKRKTARVKKKHACT